MPLIPAYDTNTPDMVFLVWYYSIVPISPGITSLEMGNLTFAYVNDGILKIWIDGLHESKKNWYYEDRKIAQTETMGIFHGICCWFLQ